MQKKKSSILTLDRLWVRLMLLFQNFTLWRSRRADVAHQSYNCASDNILRTHPLFHKTDSKMFKRQKKKSSYLFFIIAFFFFLYQIFSYRFVGAEAKKKNDDKSNLNKYFFLGLWEKEIILNDYLVLNDGFNNIHTKSAQLFESQSQ